MYFDMPKMSSENFENRKFIHSLIWLSNCIILDIFHYFSFIGRWLKSVRAEHSATAKGKMYCVLEKLILLILFTMY